MWPALLGNIALTGAFTAADYLTAPRGKRSFRKSFVKSALPTAGFMVQEMLQPKYKDDWEPYEEWVEPTRVAGFNPRAWGRYSENREVDVYGVGRRKNTGWSKTY